MTPRTRKILEFILDNLVWFMLILVLAIFSAAIPNYFQLGIFANIIEASSVLGVMSIGLSLVIIAGHMDLSVESVAALSAMVVKTDRKDARGIAQLLRMGWYRPVHRKSPPAQEIRALLVGRKLLQAKLHEFYAANSGDGDEV